MISDAFFSRSFSVPSRTLLGPQLAPKWPPKHQKLFSEGILFRTSGFSLNFDWCSMIFYVFSRARNPSRIGRADEICTFPKISLFTPEDYFGVIFWCFLRSLGTPNPCKSALGSTFKSFWFLIDLWTSFFWLFGDFGVPQGVPGDPKKSSSELF